jgi:hypothetical protein
MACGAEALPTGIPTRARGEGRPLAAVIEVFPAGIPTRPPAGIRTAPASCFPSSRPAGIAAPSSARW